MYQTFLYTYIFFLCINGGIFIVENTVPNVPLTSPFDNTKNIPIVQQSSFGNLYNATNQNGTVAESVVNPKNGTTLFDKFIDWFNIGIAVVETIIGVLFGGFIGQVLALFGFHWSFIVVVYALQGLFLILTIIFYRTSKGL